MKEFLFVFVGGGIGSSLRYLVSLLWKQFICQPWVSNPILFPWPTLVANVLGCFLIGLFYAHASSWHLKPDTTLLLTTGLCGGLTTFSTFSWESISLLRSGQTTLFLIYIILSLLLGFLALLAGNRL